MKNIISFTCKGHKNIFGMHKNTFEFTKDKELTVNGDCIIGVGANFSIDGIKNLLVFDRIKVLISVCEISDEIIADVNKNFCDHEEIVFRLGSFVSDRTLGINSTKSAVMVNREIIKKMKDPSSIMEVVIEGYNENEKA